MGVDPGDGLGFGGGLSLGRLDFLYVGFCLFFWDFRACRGAGEGFEHGLGGDVTGPFVLVGGIVIGFALAALLLLAEQAVVGAERGADHRGVLGVEFDDDFYVVGVDADQAEQVFCLGSGGDALGCQLGLIGVDGGQGGDPGDRGVVSGAGGFRGVFYRRGEKSQQGVHEIAVGLRRKVDGRGRGLWLGFHSGFLAINRKYVNVWLGEWRLVRCFYEPSLFRGGYD